MGVRHLTWQHVVVCVALLAAVVVACELFGEVPASVMLVVSAIVNLLLGSARPLDLGASRGEAADGRAKVV